jgi:hypothetical protein
MKKQKKETLGWFIKEMLRKKNRKVEWLAKKLDYKDVSSLYRLLKKSDSIKVKTMLEISELLDYNLFNYYIDKKEIKEKEEKENK